MTPICALDRSRPEAESDGVAEHTAAARRHRPRNRHVGRPRPADPTDASASPPAIGMTPGSPARRAEMAWRFRVPTHAAGTRSPRRGLSVRLDPVDGDVVVAGDLLEVELLSQSIERVLVARVEEDRAGVL